MQRDRTLPHIPALDGLRGVAVVGVLLYHGGKLRGGFLGVDLFFVLSGYLITSLLLLEWGASRGISLRYFWARRARRLLPALTLLLLAVSVYAWKVASPFDLDQIRGDGLATLFYVANWHTILQGVSYFQLTSAPSPLQHTWSLAIEEQFYVLWPLLVVGALRLRNRPSTVQRVSTVLAVGSVALTIGLHLSGWVSDNALYLGTETRIAAIAMGAVLASWQLRRGRGVRAERRIVVEGLALAGVVGLGVAWSQLDVTDGFLYSGGLALCGLAVVAILLSVTDPTRMVVTWFFELPPLRWLGLVSYGLYLWHWPVYVYLSAARTGQSSWALLGIRVGASLALAVLSYALVEHPIRRGLWRHFRPRIATPAVLGLCAVALVASTSGAVSLPTVQPKHNPFGTAYIADPADPHAPKLVVFGDSVGYFLSIDGIAPQLSQLHVSLAELAQIGCHPLIGAGKALDNLGRPKAPPLFENCTKNWLALARQKRPDVTLVVMGGAPDITIQLSGAMRSTCDPIYEQTYATRMENVLRAVRPYTKELVLTTVPRITNPTTLSVLPDDVDQRFACMNTVWHQIAAAVPNTRLVDLGSVVCPPSQGCIPRVGGADLRPDGLHFLGDGAKVIAAWLVPRALESLPGQPILSDNAPLEPPGIVPLPPNSAFCVLVSDLRHRLGLALAKTPRQAAQAIRDADYAGLLAAAPKGVRADLALLAKDRESIAKAFETDSIVTMGRDLTFAERDLLGRLSVSLNQTCPGS